jgi:hypothetical protein
MASEESSESSRLRQELDREGGAERSPSARPSCSMTRLEDLLLESLKGGDARTGTRSDRATRSWPFSPLAGKSCAGWQRLQAPDPGAPGIALPGAPATSLVPAVPGWECPVSSTALHRPAAMGLGLLGSARHPSRPVGAGQRSGIRGPCNAHNGDFVDSPFYTARVRA